jgi:hypothetical protein
LKVRGVEEKKRKKNTFYTFEKFFFFLYNYSFASAVERRIGELKIALPLLFKSLKMKKRQGRY